MMRMMLSGVLVALLFLLAPAAYGFSTKGEDCAKCHKLTKEDATALLNDLFQGAKVLDIRMSPVKGVWEVDMEAGGKKGPIYVDFSKKHLIAGSLIEIKGKKNLTQKRAQELNKVDVAKIPLDDAIVMGEKTAKYRIIVFDDPD